MHDRRGNVMALLVTLAAAAVMFLTGWLMRPVFPEPPYFIDWGLRGEALVPFTGSIIGGGIGNAPLSRGPSSQAGIAAELLRRGAPFGVLAVMSRQTDGMAPLIGVFDGAGDEIALLGVDGPDLLYRGRTRAREWGLADPVMRAHGALDSLEVGDTALLSTDFSRAGRCFDVARIRYCGVGFTAGSAWALFTDPRRIAFEEQAFFDGAVLALLALPIGILATPGSALLLALALAWYAVFRLPLDTVLLPPPIMTLALMLAGTGTGMLLRRVLRHRTTATAEPTYADEIPPEPPPP